MHSKGELNSKSKVPQKAKELDSNLNEIFFRTLGLKSDGTYEADGSFSGKNEAVQKSALAIGQSAEHRMAGEVMDQDVFWSCTTCMACVEACPVDAIMGANKQMHTVIPDLCTGCDLCVAPCPVDCITMIPTSGTSTGWQAWSQEQADSARQRFHQREMRLIREKQENEKRLLAKAHEKLKLVSLETAETQAELDEKERKKKIIANAIQRASIKKDAQAK